MRLADFRALVRRLAREVPPDFLDGVTEIVVSPRTVPHPTRAEVYTLGECIPMHAADLGGVEGIQSRVVLYHGSFQALAHLDDSFDWQTEAWETLSHELRHHLEWRANAPDLEAYDRAAEANFARRDGEAFDPLFFLDGEPIVPGVYQVDEDVFLDHVVRRIPAEVRFGWHGRQYRAPLPDGLTLPAFCLLDGVAEPPSGDLALVVRHRARWRDLLAAPLPRTVTVTAIPVAGPRADPE